MKNNKTGRILIAHVTRIHKMNTITGNDTIIMVIGIASASIHYFKYHKTSYT